MLFSFVSCQHHRHHDHHFDHHHDLPDKRSMICDSDTECKLFDPYKPICIKRRCYPKRSHSETCDHHRQCVGFGQECLWWKCTCSSNYRWLRSRCASYSICDYTSDCSTGEYCNHGKCIHRGLSGFQIGLIVLGGVTSFLLTICFLHCLKVRREHQGLLGSHTTITTVCTSRTLTPTLGRTNLGYENGTDTPKYDPPPPYPSSSKLQPVKY